jgi:regulator of nonsense transcripts 1
MMGHFRSGSEKMMASNNLAGAVLGGWHDTQGALPSNPYRFENENEGGEEPHALEEAPMAAEEDNGGEMQMESLPAHACSYCGIHNTSCVVKCVSSSKWFCNGLTRGRDGKPGTGSHIIQHLVRSKHKEVALHPDSPLGDATLECYNCGCRNAFLLGFIPAQAGGTVVLLCREPCLNLGALKEQGWNLSLWQPLIDESRAFLPWLVKVPSEAETARCRAVSKDQMVSLETLWRSQPGATLNDLLRAEAEGRGLEELGPQVENVLLQYEDGYHFQNVFAPLVKLEADEDKMTKEGLKQDGVAVRWEAVSSGSKKWMARFLFSRPDTDQKLMTGDEMRLKLPSLAGQLGLSGADSGNDEGATAVSGIVRSVQDGEVTLEVADPAPLGGGRTDRLPTNGYTVEIVWRSVTFDRMQAALKAFAVDDTSLSGYLYHALLGHHVEPLALRPPVPAGTQLNAPGLPELNPSQLAAVKTVLIRPLSLIQGPPGTGKTVTSATIVYHLSKQGQGQVLVAAPSNVAVDHLTEKIAATGLKVVRVSARSREAVSNSVEHLCLHSMVQQLSSAGFGGVPAPVKAELKKLAALKAEVGELTGKDDERYRRLTRQVERELLKAADVVCTTVAGAGDARLSGMRFKQVLIDEATQACEPECLIPLVKGCKQVVLVGDHCQLGPVILSKRAAAAGLVQSLFERLIVLGIRPIRLAVQYRMHPALSEFPSNVFYEGSLQNGVTLDQRTPKDHALAWPVPSRPMFFYVSTGSEEISSSGTSYVNRGEAVAVEKIVSSWVSSGVSPSQIGVITPYEGQRAYTVAYMTQNGSLRSSVYSGVEVASVDSFQGREKDYIIVSCVRSNEHAGIGFLSDPRRLNVAMTRARYGLVFVGNPRLLTKQPLWYALLSHFKGYDCLVEGPLNSLKATHMHLQAPKQAYVARYASSTGIPEDTGVDGGEVEDGSGLLGTIGHAFGNVADAAIPRYGFHPVLMALSSMPFLGMGLSSMAQAQSASANNQALAAAQAQVAVVAQAQAQAALLQHFHMQWPSLQGHGEQPMQAMGAPAGKGSSTHSGGKSGKGTGASGKKSKGSVSKAAAAVGGDAVGAGEGGAAKGGAGEAEAEGAGEVGVVTTDRPAPASGSKSYGGAVLAVTKGIAAIPLGTRHKAPGTTPTKGGAQ